MTSVSKTSVLKEDNLVIIGKSFKNKNEYGLTAEQATYIEKQLADNKKLVSINQFTRLVFVVVLDDKKESTQQRELLRRAGNTVTGALNEHKKKSAIITSTADAKFTLAFIEGVLLGNYQFIKHKSTAAKEKNTLSTIYVHDKAVTEKQLEEVNIVAEATCKARDLV
ncbi:MAG TPA: hypothetical protein VKG26_09275, partial [Bacteroidia bacterium]|nr:hypothetical protein [Bacteroidia bacterium]